MVNYQFNNNDSKKLQLISDENLIVNYNSHQTENKTKFNFIKKTSTAYSII